MCVIDWKRTCGSPIECSRRWSKPPRSGAAVPTAICPPSDGRKEDLIKRPTLSATEPVLLCRHHPGQGQGEDGEGTGERQRAVPDGAGIRVRPGNDLPDAGDAGRGV